MRPSQHINQLFGIIGIAIFMTGCASLPEVRYLNTSLVAPDSPTVTNGKGKVNASKSKPMLYSRWLHWKKQRLAVRSSKVTR